MSSSLLQSEKIKRFQIVGFIDKRNSDISKRILDIPILNSKKKISVVLRAINAQVLILSDNSLSNIEKLKISLWSGNPIKPGEPRNDDDMGYSELIMKYPDKIVKILKKQNKQKLLESVNISDSESFKKMILDPKYFLTDLDIWILARQTRLPIVLFSSTTLKYLFDKDEKDEFIISRAAKATMIDRVHFWQHI